MCVKKLWALILFLLSFFSQVGYQAVYIAQQAIIREEQKQKILHALDDSELEQFAYEADMQFHDEGKEFSLHGELYDIVRTKTINGKVIYFVLNDEKESSLVHKMNEANRNHSQDKAAGKGLLKVPLLFLDEQADRQTPIPPTYSVKHPVLPHLIGTSYKRIIVPPPNSCRTPGIV